MRARFWLLTAVAVIAAGIGVFAATTPVADFRPHTWEPGTYRPVAFNDRLAAGVAIGGVPNGPEDVAADRDGHLFAGTEDGWIMRADLNSTQPRFERFAAVGARPLGLATDADGILYVANHGVGLQSVSPDGNVETLLTHADGKPILFANDIALDSRGRIYFSDASSRYNRSTLGIRSTYSVPDYLEGRPFGRVIRYDPLARAAAVLADNLYFPNGVALTRDERALIVAETARNRLTRIWLEGPRAGAIDILADRLPGIADGLTALGDGRMLLAAYYRSDALDRTVAPSALMRHIMARMPDAFWAANTPSGFVMVVDDQTGEIVDQLHAVTRRIDAPANAILRNGTLHMGTLRGTHIWSVPFPTDGAPL